MRFPIRKIALFLFLSSLALAGEGKGSIFSNRIADGGIPLSHETAFQQKGLGVGLGAGAFFPSGSSCNTLAEWEGALEYDYASFLSGGFSVRMYGGDIDDENFLIYQRYYTNVRLHALVSPRWDIFLSPKIGFETTSLSELRDEFSARGDRNFFFDGDDEGGCKNEYRLDGFSSGLEIGTGFLLSRDFAVNGAFGIEYNFAKVGQISLGAGIGFNLRNHWNYLKENFLGGWIVLEFLGHHYISGNSSAWGEAFLLALVLSI